MASNRVEDRLLTVADVAEYLGLSVGTIYNKVSAGEIPHIRLGRTLRFRLSEIDAWIAEQDAARKARLDEAGRGKDGAAEVGGIAAPLARTA